VTSLAESKSLGAGEPFTNTVTAVQVAGTGVVRMQAPGNCWLPRLVPVMATTIPGAIGPAVIEAAFSTDAAVNVGAWACAESARTERESEMPMSVVRNVYSISDETMSKSVFSVANLLLGPWGFAPLRYRSLRSRLHSERRAPASGGSSKPNLPLSPLSAL
jgi:hypothetical protein